MKRVAVIILNWNGEKLLPKYLPQVVANTPDDLADIIVADNASTDNSLSIIAKDFPSVKTMVFDRNYGFAAGYNKAIALADSEFVVLLNSDVAPQPRWLEPLVALMDSDTTVAACAPKIKDDKRPTHFEYAGAAGGYLDMFGYPFCRGRIMTDIEEDSGQYNNNANVLWVSGAAMLVRRRAYMDCGGLDEDFFAHMEEIDLCWRMANRGYKIVACGQAEVRHLGGATLDSTNPQKTYLNFRNNLFMLTKNLNTDFWPIVLFFRMILDGLAGLKFIAEGKWPFCKAIIRAHIHFHKSFGRTLAKRKALAGTRCKHRPEGVEKMCLIWQYYICKRRLFRDLLF